MEYLYIGRVTTTHGIKGEIKILSDFLEKDKIFKKGFKLYLSDKKEEQEINSYRPHQKFDMVTLKGLNDINEVLKYRGVKVYINKSDLEGEFLVENLLNYTIVKNEFKYGTVKDIIKSKGGILLYIDYPKPYYIPYVPEFINNIDENKQEITVLRVEEFL